MRDVDRHYPSRSEPNMLGPLKYEKPVTYSTAPDGLVDGNGGGVGLVDGTPRPPVMARPPRGVHPLHWLVDGHWLGRRRTPLLLKFWRYGAGSIVAFVVSVFVVYACFSWVKLGASTSAIIGFVAGALPNWVLNRRWAWQQRGREGVGRETTLYVLVSVFSLVASTAVTKFTAVEATHVSNVMRDFLVTASYTFSIVVLTVLKFVAYDRWVFIDRSGEGSSRHQVPSTTEANRRP